jgi:hypothetical protein
MALLLRRGLEADRLSFTPEEGELIYVTDTKLIYVGDGVTAGGNLLSGGTAPPSSPTYALTRSSATVNEGGTVTITLTTTNVVNGTVVPYTITGTGITAGDLGLSSLTGSFTVNSNTASLVLNIAADATTEGSETFTVTLNSITPTTNVSVTINDTSVPTIPTYTLSRSSSSVTEGSFFTITLTTTNVVNGTSVPYTITGVNSNDIDGASLTGAFVINANTDSIVFNVTDDGLTEGTETFVLTLNGISGSGSNVFVTISDPTVGNIDGGSPTTPSFDEIIDGGSPTTPSFDEIIDGGTV